MTPGGRCINVNRYYVVKGSINAFTNFVLLALVSVLHSRPLDFTVNNRKPIPLLWKLRTSNMQKFILTIVFTVGLTYGSISLCVEPLIDILGSVCAVGVIRLTVLSNLREEDVTWNYVPAAKWSAAEPSIGVVSACLPSLRPLFTRLVWGRSYHPKHGQHSSHHGLNTSWLSSNKNQEIGRHNGSFNLLREGDSLKKPWTRNVAITGGGMDDGGSEEYDIDTRADRRTHFEVPTKGIRVRTTVTITEGVDWRDDLF
ncbi:MAG: hypothetical protein Q9217_000304 [Psora testacea]